MFRARHGDIAASFCTLAFAGYLYAQTLGMSERITAYPRLIASILAAAAILLLIQAIRRKDAGAEVFSDIAWKPLMASTLVWVTAIFLTIYFGFYPVIAVMLAVVMWILEGFPRSMPVIVRGASFGVAMATLLWMIFRQMLGVVTPAGTIF